MKSLKIAVTAIFTALVCAATMLFSVYVPATHGFFNVGESMIFLSALLFGPFVGAFSGGVGSMFADLLLGFPHYAPASLIIKGCEGAVVGLLKRRSPRFSSKLQWSSLTIMLGSATGGIFGGVGATYYSGWTELTLGVTAFSLYIPAEFWLAMGAVVAISIIVAGLLFDPEIGWTIFSVIMGGLCMVLGYFLYQWLLLYPLFKIEAVALAEVPLNVGQMIIGAIVAIPISKMLMHTLPQLKVK
ncbi:MAG: ECF transporter S component [Nitrososphaerota archaeon]|nr:ECF transporter S component [Candidatus Bathyarchaeota archaeon]MDW8193434.1 ECF transporter S component [Nitrososphaerota archaeon]